MPTVLDKRPDILRFGSDGWQARYDKGFTRDNVVRLAEALGTVWSEELPGGIVFVGFDTRFEADSSALEAAATLASFGLDVRVSETFCQLHLFAGPAHIIKMWLVASLFLQLSFPANTAA